MADLSKILGGPWSPPVSPVPLAPEIQFAEAIRRAGLEVPEIILDGKLRRFRSTESKKFDRSGWYVGHADGIPCITFGCWREDITQTVKADVGGKKWTPAEEMAHIARVAAAKKQRDAEIERDRSVAASTVETIWSGGVQASPEHPYLKRKGIQPHGARVTGDGRLMLPLFSPDGELCSLQYIDDSHGQGEKRYHTGGQTGGMFWMLGTLDEPGTLYIAEGFATAATIHQVTGRPCVVAYSAGSLVPVTGSLREQMPNQDLVIVADHDESGIGQKYAEQASAKHGARMVLIPIKGDANDYQQAGHDLASLLNPPQSNIITKLKAVFGNELGTDYEAPDELIEGLLVMGSLAVTYGDSNSG
ncbi:MAG: toprim domain-containing protein, partial [Candidatus Nanopelagicaceae bacterium]